MRNPLQNREFYSVIWIGCEKILKDIFIFLGLENQILNVLKQGRDLEKYLTIKDIFLIKKKELI